MEIDLKLENGGEKLIKKLLILMVFLMAIGSAAAANPDNMGNKYVVSNFTINTFDNSFSATLTNQNNGAVGDGYYEISTGPAANHANILQNGTFNGGIDTFRINDYLTFTPDNSTTYYLLVYTNYPEHDNRVSKDLGVFIYEIIQPPAA